MCACVRIRVSVCVRIRVRVSVCARIRIRVRVSVCVRTYFHVGDTIDNVYIGITLCVIRIDTIRSVVPSHNEIIFAVLVHISHCNAVMSLHDECSGCLLNIGSEEIVSTGSGPEQDCP